MKNLLYLFLAIALFTSCEKDEPQDQDPIVNLPFSNFSYVINNSFPPAEVSFTNSSAYAADYIWEFGDGSTTTETNPVHTYTASGGFTAKLRASDTLGNHNVSTQTIYINALPTHLFLKKMTIKEMPFTNQVGQDWDEFDGPDVYASFQEISYDIITQTDVIDNIEEAALPVSWTWGDPYFSLVEIGHDFLIVFIEYDGINQFSGMETPIVFNFADHTGYPDVIELTSPNGTFVIELEVVWQ